VLEPGIILVREAPHSNAEVFRVFVETAEELGKPFGVFAVVNDLTEAATRPKRHHLAIILDALNTVGVHWAVTQPGSGFLRVVARFIIARVARDASRITMHDNLQSALAAARKAVGKAAHPPSSP
jgi:hypothetical protein